MAVRALAGIISEFGLLSPRDIFHLPMLISAWQNNEGRSGLKRSVRLYPAAIEFIGLFDSVMGGIEWLPAFQPVRFNEYDMAQQCRRGVQILAIDESRPHFRPKLWTGLLPQMEVRMGGRTRIVRRRKWFRQIWMPGSHSDVGGTGNALLGSISLASMIYFIRKGTFLSFNDSDLEDIEHKIRISLPQKKFSMSKNHFNVMPLRTFKTKINEIYFHPICKYFNNVKFTYKLRKSEFYRRYKYDWQKKVFNVKIMPHLNECKQLSAYFESKLFH